MYREVLKFLSGNFEFNPRELAREYINKNSGLEGQDQLLLDKLDEYKKIYPKDSVYTMLKLFKPLVLHMAKLKYSTDKYLLFVKSINKYFSSIEINRQLE